MLSRWGHSIAVWARQAGNDEVIQQAGLRPWQLVLRPVPVLTGAVVPCARCCDPNSTPALPLCCFFISLVLAQSAVELARPTAWIYSCCKALGPSHSFSLSLSVCLYLWSTHCDHSPNRENGSGYIPNTLVNSIMLAFNALMCSYKTRIIKRTDAVWPQQSFVVAYLSYGWRKMYKTEWWRSEGWPFITW